MLFQSCQYVLPSFVHFAFVYLLLQAQAAAQASEFCAEDEKHAAYDDTSSMENGLPAAIPETASHVAARSTDEADPSLAAHMTGNTTLSKQHVAQKPEEERKQQHILHEKEVQQELLEAKAAAKEEEEEEEDTRISTQQEEQAAEVHTLFYFSVLL